MAINSVFSISRFAKERLDQFSLSSSTKEYLQIIGLPLYASPYLGFGDDDEVALPRLKDWPRLKPTPPEKYYAYIVIGSGYIIGSEDDDCPICVIEDNEQIVIINQVKEFECIFMNSSVIHLAAFINSYRAFLDQIEATDGLDVYAENRVPLDFIQELQEELAEIDVLALTPGSFWANQIVYLQEGTKKFEKLKKYSFELWGYINKNSSDKEKSIRLEEITVLADAQVIRAVAEFFSHCADGIEKHGKKWEHEHFQDNWKDWYSDYPEIIVCQSRKRSKRVME